MKQQDDNQRRTLFCVFAARGFAPEEAARRAGFDAEDCGTVSAQLLCDAKIRKRISKLSRELTFCSPAALARAGLERIALGEPDGVLPLLGDDGIPTVGGLFHAAEIKRPKGGGIEIKFYDRLRALSLLAELNTGAPEETNSLLSALARSAEGADAVD